MNNIKRKAVLVAILAITTFVSCSKKDDVKKDEGKNKDITNTSSSDDNKQTINIWAFTNIVPDMAEKYCEINTDFAKKYEFKSKIISENEYQSELDIALNSNEAPDVYVADSAFVHKYAKGDAAKYASTYNDLGIDVNAKINQAKIAQYIVDIGTNPFGDVVALGYQSTGGAFIYRRSIAKNVFGTDEPKVIEKEIGPGWDKFFEAAEKLSCEGYGIVSGIGDVWQAVESSADQGWIVDGKLTIDSKREALLDYAKILKDNDFMNDTANGQDEWFADMSGEGVKEIFGFFGPACFINSTLVDHCGGTYGDWAICTPPVSFFSGGSWLFANKNSSVKEGIGKFIEWVTLDSSESGLQYMMANATYSTDSIVKDSVASNTVMDKSHGELEFLNGQNIFDVYVSSNKVLNGNNITQYDEIINKYWIQQVNQYVAGKKSREDAISEFKQNVANNLDITVE